MSRLVILDNTVLSNFALVDRSDLALLLWPDSVCTTAAAYCEYLTGVEQGILPPRAWHDLPRHDMGEEENRIAQGLASRLGAGERSCIAVALVRNGVLASDDLLARQIARQHGVAVTGTLGILVLCVQRDLLSQLEADRLSAAMIAKGYHSPVQSLAALLDR